jgi:putative glycosyltransferase (TIGR04372 family)
VFLLGNGAIGHYPLNMLLSREIYGDNCVYVFKSGVKFANEYLNNKLKSEFNFNQSYEELIQLMKSISFLTFGLYKYTEFPEQMKENIGYSQALGSGKTLFSFTDIENNIGIKYLEKYNINPNKFVCFHMRSSEYNLKFKSSNHRENTSFKFRNTDPKTHLPGIEYLCNSGYSVIRMGKYMKEPFSFKHDNFIDYAISDDRNDFLDIWLGSKCKFMFGPSSGGIQTPILFNGYFLDTGVFPIGRIWSWAPKTMYLPRLAKKNNKLLSIKDLVELNIIGLVDGEYCESLGVEILPCTENEILRAVKDIEQYSTEGAYTNLNNIKFWKKMRQEWNGSKSSEWNLLGWNFDYFHDITDIKTVIPDFYLEKYSDVFLN